MQGSTQVIEEGRSVQMEEGDVAMEAEFRGMQSLAGGGRSQEMWAASTSWTGQAKEFFPRVSRRNAALLTP